MAKKSFFKKAQKKRKAQKKKPKRKADFEDLHYAAVEKKSQELSRLDAAIAKEDRKLKVLKEKQTGEDAEESSDEEGATAYEKLLGCFGATGRKTASAGEDSEEEEEESDVEMEDSHGADAGMGEEDAESAGSAGGDLEDEEENMDDLEDVDGNGMNEDLEEADVDDLPFEDDELPSESEEAASNADGDGSPGGRKDSEDFYGSFREGFASSELSAVLKGAETAHKKKLSAWDRGVFVAWAGNNSSSEGTAATTVVDQDPAPKDTDIFCRRYLPLLKDSPHENIEEAKSDLKNFPEFFRQLNSYADVLFPSHEAKNSRAVRISYSLHIVNHVLKAREEVLASNAAIQKLQKKTGDFHALPDDPSSVRDQGFSRLRAVILCPFKSVCHEVATLIAESCPNATQVLESAKFEKHFAEPPADFANRLLLGEVLPPTAAADNKPPLTDLQHLFSGNNDDKFHLGITVARKAVKLFTPPNSSDVLIASPLALKLLVDERGGDFLSSVEVLVLDRTDVMQMQNFEHVVDCLKTLNRKPEKIPESCDITRLRSCFTRNESRFLRQTVVTSCGMSGDLGALLSDEIGGELFCADLVPADVETEQGRAVAGRQEGRQESGKKQTRVGKNFRGVAKLCCSCPAESSALREGGRLGISRQMFLVARAMNDSVTVDSTMGDSPIFKHFRKGFWETTGSEMKHLVLVVSGTGYRYGEYLKLRRWLQEEHVDFVAIDEYMEALDVKESRIDFNKGRTRVLVVTERYLFYHHDFNVRSTENLVFLGTPSYASTYLLGCSWISPFHREVALGMPSVLTICDAVEEKHEMERILGSEIMRKKLAKARANKLLTFNS